MNAPPPQHAERRGASGSPDGPSSLVFFGGIVLGIVLVGSAALAIWGPEKDTSGKAIKLATDPPPPEILPSLPPDPTASGAVPPPVAEAPTDAPPPDGVPKKKGKRGGKGKKPRPGPAP